MLGCSFVQLGLYLNINTLEKDIFADLVSVLELISPVLMNSQ